MVTEISPFLLRILSIAPPLGGARWDGVYWCRHSPQVLRIEEGGAYNDITPIRSTTAAGDVTFSATDGSSTITVTDSNHDAVIGDFVTFSGAASLGGVITADVLNQEYQIDDVLRRQHLHHSRLEQPVPPLKTSQLMDSLIPTPVVSQTDPTPEMEEDPLLVRIRLTQVLILRLPGTDGVLAHGAERDLGF
jgi:hypothetical protein